MIQHPHFPMPQQRKALTPLFRHDEQKTGKGYASLTKGLRGADKAPKDRRTWGKPFPPASSPVLRLLRESLCLVDNLTGASPLQGNPLFLAADAGGKRLSCNEAPRRTNRMQLKAALCTCPPLAYRVHRLPPRGSDKLPPPPHKRAVSAPPGFRQPEPPSPKAVHAFPTEHTTPSAFLHRVLPRRKTPEHADMFRQYRPCDFQTGFIGERKTKSPAGGAGMRSPQGFKRRKAPEKEPFQR